MHWTVIVSAITLLAPGVPKPAARVYAKAIAAEAPRRDIDPLFVVAFVHSETGASWNPRLVSDTADYGLGQVHVAARGSSRFLGRERELFIPRVNIKEWSRIADMWRNYHARTCKPGSHRWWAHMKWGYRVKDPTTGAKVQQIYSRLKARFSVPEV